MSNNTTPFFLADDIHVLPAKRSGDDDQDDELLGLPPPSKRERMDPSYHFGPQDEHGQEEAVDFAMQLLDGQIAAPNEPSLEFSVAPHRDTIGLRSGEFVSQVRTFYNNTFANVFLFLTPLLYICIYSDMRKCESM